MDYDVTKLVAYALNGNDEASHPWKGSVTMADIGLRLPNELHQEAKAEAASRGMNLSEFIRLSMRMELDREAGQAPDESEEAKDSPALTVLIGQLSTKDTEIARLHDELAAKDSQLTSKDDQIDQLHQLQAQLQLQLQEAHTERKALTASVEASRRTVWQRVRAVFAVEST